jgi:HEAT repeat protein
LVGGVTLLAVYLTQKKPLTITSGEDLLRTSDEDLLRTLENEGFSFHQREEAASQLAERDDPRVVDHLIALLSRERNLPIPERKAPTAAIIAALARIGNPKALPILEEMNNDPHPGRRFEGRINALLDIAIDKCKQNRK